MKNGEAIATSYTGSESTVIVPTTAGGYPVTELRETFRSNSNLVKATVSKGIRIVGQYAFFNCDKLESVILPISVVSIGSNAFYSCNALEQIALPENLKIIEEKAFAYCTALVNISLPDNVTAIGNRCFQYCRNLIEITILGNITHIPDYTFANCDNLEKITIPACVTEIGDAAFAFCSKLTDLSLPNNLEVVGDAAFFDVLKCATIEVPVSLASMTKESFHQSTVLLVEENSPAHFFAVENDLLYFINSDVTEPEFYTIGGITYVVLKESAVAIAYDNCTADIVFQNVIEEVPVTEILDIFNIDYPSIFNMTSGRTEDEHPLVSVVLPDELKSIRNELFLNCGNLSNVTISHGITSIGTRAFEGCPIKSIVIPDSVINIGEYAFYECVYLENIALSVNLQSIGENAFGACTNLFEVLIPENVNEIAVNTFPEFTILLVYDASYAHVFAEENTLLFFVCDEFGNAEIYTIDGIVYGIMNEEAIAIGADSSLTSIVMPDAVEGYPVTRLYRTFYKCSSLVDITLPSELKSISDRAFFGCSGVTNITLPESLESIGKRAFYGCKSLISVVIPQNVSEIYDYPNESFPEEVILLVYENSYAHTLAQKESILHLTYNDKTLLQFCFVDGIYYVIKDDEAIAIKIDDSLTSITIPSVVEGYSVTELYATFSECTFLVSVSLPSSLKVIGDYTFNDCTNLTLITLPPNLITIGKQAFGYCTKLTSIVIPEGVTFIGEDAFQWCRKLDTITIPKSITYIGESAFWCCDSITTVLYQGDTDSWLEIIFANGLSNPCNSETASLYFNGDLVTDIVVTEGSSIPAFAFRGCQSIKSVTLSESVTQIGTSAFNSCVSLENITLSNGLSIIYGGAFENCVNLESIEIPDSVSTIGSGTFRNCTSLMTITIPASVTTIGSEAFMGCKSLNKIVIPPSIEELGTSVFRNCESLTEVIIQSGVQEISAHTFSECYSLKSAIIPDSVTNIESYAFRNCTNLLTVVIPASVSSIGSYDAFTGNVVLLVEENSYAHTFAESNDLLYFVLHKTENPEISYGAGLSGVVSYTDGSAASGATVEILYDDGTVKETVTTDETGAYAFTYAEVGKYTIRATDADGNTSSSTVSVKRMNVFDVFISGDTNLTLKQGWTVSGATSEASATVTITDEVGNVIASVETTDGTFGFNNIPNGTYVVTATTENGSIAQEITVFGGDVTDILLTIPTAAEVATIWGYVEVEDRDKNHHRRNWVEITIYNAEGIAVGQAKSDGDGMYRFANLPLGEYTIVAETAEMRKDKHHDFDRSFKLVGYAYVNAEEATEYQAETIVLYEENDHLATISGKVIAQGETQNCEVILRNIFRHEVAKQTTGNNGKYSFVNVRDGLYFIFAVTENDGMGMAIVVVRDGKVYGETDITVYKHQHIKDRDDKFREEINCNSRDEALLHRERIAEEKRFYDGLSEKEKKQLSKDYVDRLNRYSEWIADVNYNTPDGVTVEQGGLVVSGDEIEQEETITFNLTVEKQEEYVPSTDGVKNDRDYKHHHMKDTAGHREIKQYYEISMTKTTADGTEKEITSVYKDTDAMGKFRITMEIPEEYRGYKNYTVLHEHNGEVVTLVDLDDDPNTVTFEVDKFSTFALAVSDEATVASTVEGDVSNNGVLDIADVLLTLRGILNGDTENLADMTGDGKVSLLDVLRLLKSIV